MITHQAGVICADGILDFCEGCFVFLLEEKQDLATYGMLQRCEYCIILVCFCQGVSDSLFVRYNKNIFVKKNWRNLLDGIIIYYLVRLNVTLEAKG